MASVIGKGHNQQQPRAQGFRVTTSLYGQAIPLVYGRVRIAPRIIWFGNQTTQQQNVGKK